MEKAKVAALVELKKMAKPVSGKAEIKQVASISSESEVLGSIIAEAVEKVGSSGVVTVEESQGMELSYDIVEGLPNRQGLCLRVYGHESRTHGSRNERCTCTPY